MKPVILDAEGNPVRTWAGGGFDAAATGTPRTKSWQSSSLSLNSLLGNGGGDTLRGRSREAVRNNPLAARAMEAFVASAVGTGIRPLPLVEDDDLRSEITEAWEEFAEECDADGTASFYGLTATACRAFREGGDCFVRFRPRRPEDGLSVPLQIQLIESEQCDSYKNEKLPNGNVIKSGIEFDKLGRRRTYHMFRDHPGEQIFQGLTYDTVEVPADQIAHVYHVVRPGQVRGVPALANSLAKLYELDQYDDAELVRKKIAAMFAAFEETPSLDQDIIGSGYHGTATSDSTPLASLEPGTYQRLPPGHSIRFSEPADVTGNYKDFMSQQIRSIAVGTSVTFEQLSGDYSEVNYSSARAAINEFRRVLTQVQSNVLIHQFCRPIWKRWFETALISGRLSLSAELRRNPRRAMRVKWVAQGWDHVDPEKEINATVMSIRAGVLSRDQAIAMRGFDPEELDRQIAKGNERQEALGLSFDTNVKAETSQGQEGVVNGNRRDLSAA